MSENAVLWELMEMEAVEKCYLYNEQEERYADLPAIIISSGPFVSPDAKTLEFFTVWFGQGIEHYNFKHLTDAERRMKAILATSKKHKQAKIEHRDGRIELIKIEDCLGSGSQQETNREKNLCSQEEVMLAVQYRGNPIH